MLMSSAIRVHHPRHRCGRSSAHALALVSSGRVAVPTIRPDELPAMARCQRRIEIRGTEGRGSRPVPLLRVYSGRPEPAASCRWSSR